MFVGEYHVYFNASVIQPLVIGVIKMKHRIFVMFVALVLLTLTTGTVLADKDSGAASEFAYYNGQLYGLHIPSESSNSSSQFTFGCFPLGPNLNDNPTGPTATIYAVLSEGASLDYCPDGSVKHDHIISDIPGTPGYSPVWELKLVVEGPNFDPAIMPVTSEQALMDALAAGQLVNAPLPFPIVFMAPVVGLAE